MSGVETVNGVTILVVSGTLPRQGKIIKLSAAGLMLALLIIMILFLGMIQTKLTLEFEQRAHSGTFPFVDFLRFYSAGKVVLSPERMHAYEVSAQLRYLNELVAPAHFDYTSESHYLPYAFPIFAFLASMPVQTAYAVLNIVAPAVALGTLALLLRSVRGLSACQIGVFLIGMLASFPGWRCMFAGNLSWLLLCFVIPYVWASMTDRRFASGVFLALTTLKYNYTPHLLAAFVAVCRKRDLVGFVVAMLALFVFGGLYMGFSAYISFPQTLLTSEGRDAGVFPQVMISVVGPLTNVLPRHVAGIIGALTELVSMGALFWMWRKSLDVPAYAQARRRWLFAITALTMVTFNVHVHHYEAMFLVIAPALTLTKFNPVDAAALKPVSFRIWSLLWILFPIVGWAIMVVASKQPAAFGLMTCLQLVFLGLALYIYRQICRYATAASTSDDSVSADFAEILLDRLGSQT